MASEGIDPAPGPVAREEVQVVSDEDALRALGHPVRLALLEALLSGPLTATEAGELIGESATTCSFHLRQLARYGFVEEAGGGKGRARPWRRTHTGWHIPIRPDDAEFTQVSRFVHAVMLDRYFDRVRRAAAHAPAEPREWSESIIGTETMLFITAQELREVAAAYNEIQRQFAERWGERLRPELRPAGARPVELLFFGVPVDDLGDSPS